MLQEPHEVAGGKKLPGLTAGFISKIRAYEHTAWVGTALLPDPRLQATPPADPAIVKWELRGSGEALFVGDCFGDGGCTTDRHLQYAERAGWAVVEVYRDVFTNGLALGRSAAGTLPGNWQTAEGAEAYALLYWLRNLDPVSRATPRYHTDCQRVADGWHGLWNVTEPWAPNREIWTQILVAKADARQDTEVLWVRGHPHRGAAEAQGAAEKLRAFGTAAADRLAKQAKQWHPAQASEAVALRRTAEMSRVLAVSYARVLQWAVAADDRLPPLQPAEAIFRLPRPPALPRHCMAADSHGTDRCVKCLMPAAIAQTRSCTAAGVLRHCLAAIGSGVCCLRCGAYSFRQLLLLSGECRGRPADAAAAWRLRRMMGGRHPVNGAYLGEAKRIDAATEAFSLILGEPGV